MIALLAAAAVGCTNTAGVAARSYTSGWHIWVEPRGTNCGTKLPCTALGVEWTSKTPERAALVITFDGDYKVIRRATLNVDGETIQLQGGLDIASYRYAGGVMRDSSQTFIVPVRLLRQIAASKRTGLQVETSSGLVDSFVVDARKDSEALYAIKRFLIEVDA
ncbi:hypothetical protein [Dyella silvatica]|uniref:hypothetical protein n=1 Tax=Dyella silvatica TaxID=2992128 RepID=UPI00225B87E3|nr:hypothetical protein [Dyella silvatica]